MNSNSGVTFLFKKIKRFKHVFIILGIFLLIYIFFFGGYGLIKILILSNKIRKIERQIAVSSAIKEALTIDKNNMETDSTYMQMVLRQTYGMIKEGEKCTLKIK